LMPGVLVFPVISKRLKVISTDTHIFENVILSFFLFLTKGKMTLILF